MAFPVLFSNDSHSTLVAAPKGPVARSIKGAWLCLGLPAIRTTPRLLLGCVLSKRQFECRFLLMKILEVTKAKVRISRSPSRVTRGKKCVTHGSLGGMMRMGLAMMTLQSSGGGGKPLVGVMLSRGGATIVSGVKPAQWRGSSGMVLNGVDVEKSATATVEKVGKNVDVTVGSMVLLRRESVRKGRLVRRRRQLKHSAKAA